ncbi:outer membrane protein assembly factor BamE [Burkholderia pyrrocinia]|uniref:outer membrane protein assembly factor BamE n=1 Tax=Burkholderia pyrrocinia TaxID=60550 RepID=UPI001589A0BA|nr:outer membrane protein assembly factor BamE [Burkholderia pyrrocinia]
MRRLTRPVVLLAALLMSGAIHADDSVVFPPRTAAWLKEGTPAKVESVQQVAPGVSREAVYALLGKPHSSRAYCHAREWDYLLNLPDGGGHPPLRCQYKVRFDGQGKVRDTRWLPGGIAELERIGGQVKTDYRKLTSVTIIGNTDGLGKPAYNQELSLARAVEQGDPMPAAG